MKKQRLIQEAKNYLEARGFEAEEAEREVLLILAHLLACKPLEVYFVPEERLKAQERRFWTLLERRAQGVPLGYVLGEVEFYGRLFKVAPGVLIPRPETEILVEEALNLCKGDEKILELGLGSGVISLTLSLERPGLKVVAVELSPEALEVAKENRRRYRLEHRVHFVRGDWFSPLRLGANFALIVSNPPYVAQKEWPALPREVRAYEPRLALLGGEDGLFFIKETLTYAPRYLSPSGKVLLEIGYQQAEAVARLAEELGYRFYFRRDYLGHCRVLVASLPEGKDQAT